jgi:aspartyl-tRNA(Asn)/glutamyl-tRNA(Gln) amidotransferase subunit A
VTAPTAHELVAAYRRRERSPVEVAEACLATIARRDPKLAAFCFTDPETTLAQARASERRWAEGEPAGLLDGVPVAVKDVFLTAGWPTLRGFPTAPPSAVWDTDAPVVASLRRHGAVLVGKTTMPQLGWKGVTDGPGVPVTRNPCDPARTPGGSSGGSAAAVAAGMAPLAVGTDGGGSIRIPAGFCGIAGLKPTFARVPQWPPSPYVSLGHSGPMARTTADTALLLDAIAEPDAREWASPPPPPERYADALEGGVAGLRIAFSPDLGFAAVDPEVAGPVAEAVVAFESLGAHVEQVDPGFGDPREAFDVLWTGGAAGAVAHLAREQREVLDPGLASAAERGAGYSGLERHDAAMAQAALGVAMARFHADWDLLLTPTMPIAAFEAGREVPEGSRDPHWPGWTPFTYPFNLTQQPAATVPCGSTADGLPVGLQLVGPRHAEALVLRAAHAFEAAQPTGPA